MERTDVLNIQKRFVKTHILLFVIVAGYIVERITHGADWKTAVPLVFAIPFLAMERYLLYKDSVKIFWISVFRYVQVCFSMLVLVQSNYIYTFAVALLCFSMFAIEYYLTIDFLDLYFRIFYILTILIPLALCFLSVGIIHSNVNEKLMPLFFVLAVYSSVMLCLSSFFSGLISNNEEKVFAQSRLVEKLNETNEELLENQEKVKRANELLGVQKIKLETAYNKINSVNSEMMIQNDIIRYISTALEIGELMRLITESIINEIGVDVCSIVLYPGTEENDTLHYKVRSRLSIIFSEHLKQSIENQCFKPYLSETNTYVDNRVKENKYVFIKQGLIGSLIIVPLVKESEIIGALFVAHPKYDYFVENITFFEAIVAQFMIALDNANLYAKMRHMAIRDGLTNIYNRRHLTKLYNESLNEAIINRTPLSVVLYDIDKFKNINDSYGHLFGDTVIQTIASLSKEVAKKQDGILGRYGGEEFVMIFPNKGVKETYEIVDVLHKQIKAIEHIHKGEEIHISVSMGITSYPETCKNPSELLNRADWAMYYSKQNGRDRITIDADDIRENVMLK